jgi:hypothetical protein
VDAAHGEQFDGARQDRHGLGMRCPLGAPLKDRRGNTAAAQFRRQPHAHRAAARDDDVEIAVRHGKQE